MTKLIDDVKESLKGEDTESIKEKTSKLQEKAMELAGRVYQEAQNNAANENTSNNNDNDDEVSEAEFVDKK